MEFVVALTYLSLVNNVLEKLNEVTLTSGNFATAKGVHAAVKGYINDAISTINTAEFFWPFNKTTKSVSLVAGTYKYNIDPDVLVLDWDSFIIDKAADTPARKLRVISYDEWFQRYFETQENTAAKAQPELVVRQQLGQFYVFPTPDKAYTLKYDAFIKPAKLVNHDDTTLIPDTFEDVIINYAMWQAYMFRSNSDADKHNLQFRNGLKNMRTVLGNPYEKVRDARVNTQTR